jgi:hypothetical protein
MTLPMKGHFKRYVDQKTQNVIALLVIIAISGSKLPWIPEPSVNNKLKRREGSGSTGGFFD